MDILKIFFTPSGDYNYANKICFQINHHRTPVVLSAINLNVSRQENFYVVIQEGLKYMQRAKIDFRIRKI